jgi:hypothetical protein
VGHDGEVVERLFDEQPDDPVAVENEVGAVGGDVADLAVGIMLRVLSGGRRWGGHFSLCDCENELKLQRLEIRK